MEAAELEGYVDNAHMRQITNHHATDITLTLQNLVSQGSLTQEVQGRWIRYNLPTQPDSSHKEISYSVHKGEIPEDQWAILLELAKPAQRINVPP